MIRSAVTYPPLLLPGTRLLMGCPWYCVSHLGEGADVLWWTHSSGTLGLADAP